MATSSLPRHLGLLQASAVNISMIVGAGVVVTIPLMLNELPGPYALLGRLTVAVTGGVAAVIGWILVEGLLHADLTRALDTTDLPPVDLTGGLGKATILAMYSYLGYYNVCYVGDEVRERARRFRAQYS